MNPIMDFLGYRLPMFSQEVPVLVIVNMRFMHGGTPAHFNFLALQHLDITYRNLWIGCVGPQNLPTGSPDLNDLDFNLRGHLKSLFLKLLY